MEVLGLVNIPVWVIILCVLLYSFYRYASSGFDVFHKMGVNGPKPWVVMGNQMATIKMGFVEVYEHWFKKYGRIFGVFEGMHPLLVVGDIDMLKEITVKQFNNFTNRRTFKMDEVSYPPVNKFLTILKDDEWRHVRNTLTPTFSGGKLKKMKEMIGDCGKTFVSVLNAKADSGEPLEMKEYTGAYTMDVIAATAFGIKLNTQLTPNDPFIKYARKFFDFNLLSLSLIILFFFPFLSPLVKLFRLPISPKDSMAFFTDVVKQALVERRQNPGKYSDFLQLMINAEKESQSSSESGGNLNSHSNEAVEDTHEADPHWKDKRKGQGLTDHEIIAACIIFFAAGYDTTASTLAYLFYHLAMNPDQMDKLIAEIDNHYPDGKTPDYETINSLPYLDMVIQEGLRINPPVARMDRMCNQETTIKGITIPAGMGVALPIYMIHHDPGYWTDPETFDAERFTPERKETHHPVQWIPFGYGPRNCIGMRLALFEMKIVVVQLLQKYRFIPNSKTEPLKFKDNPFLSTTKSGVWLTAENRK